MGFASELGKGRKGSHTYARTFIQQGIRDILHYGIDWGFLRVAKGLREHGSAGAAGARRQKVA